MNVSFRTCRDHTKLQPSKRPVTMLLTNSFLKEEAKRFCERMGTAIELTQKDLNHAQANNPVMCSLPLAKPCLTTAMAQGGGVGGGGW